MVVAFDGFFARAEAGISIVPAENTVASTVVALRANAEAVTEIGVLFSTVGVA